MKLKSVFPLFFLCGFIPALSHGWGGNGHRIVGAIAASYLTQEARNAVTDLVGEESLAQVSTWADEIKSDESYDWAYRIHFINLPRDAEKVDMARDCVAGECVVAAINKFTAIMADAKEEREKRIEALKFHRVIMAGQEIELALRYDRDRSRLRFHFTRAGKDLSSGRILFEAAP